MSLLLASTTLQPLTKPVKHIKCQVGLSQKRNAFSLLHSKLLDLEVMRFPKKELKVPDSLPVANLVSMRS
jgi:hypothetical protein